MSSDLRAALMDGETGLRAYIERKLMERIQSNPEYQALRAEQQAEEDRIINGTGETPETRAMLSRPGIGTVPRDGLYVRSCDGALLRPSDGAVCFTFRNGAYIKLSNGATRRASDGAAIHTMTPPAKEPSADD